MSNVYFLLQWRRTSVQWQWQRQRLWLYILGVEIFRELFVCVCELFVNKVLKTVLNLSLLFIGPMVALMLAHWWPTGGPTGMPHANGTTNVGPPVAQQWHATVGPTLAHWQKWHWPTGGCQRWPNGGATSGPTLGHRGRAIWDGGLGIPVAQRWATRVVLSGMVAWGYLKLYHHYHCVYLVVTKWCI